MEIKDFVQRELDSVVANGGVQQDDFTARSIMGNVEVLEKGWVFQTFGKVFRNVVNKKAGTFAEYKLARMFKLTDKGTVDEKSMRIVPIYPFANAIDGKVIKVDNVTITQIRRYGTETDTTNSKTYTFSYADDVKLPEIAE